MIRVITLVALIVLSLIGSPVWAESPHTPTTYVVWVDISRSIKQADIRRWQSAVESRLLPRIACGDRLLLLPIQKDSMAAAVQIDWQASAVDEEPTRSELLVCRRAQADLKRQISHTFDELGSTEPNAGWTDILGTFDRLESLGVQRVEGKAIVAIFLSDMKQVSPLELNLEKVKVTEDKIGPLTDTIIAKHKTATHAWTGVTVRCWLNPAGPNVAPPLNGQRELKAFYAELFKKAGGALTEFQPL